MKYGATLIPQSGLHVSKDPFDQPGTDWSKIVIHGSDHT